MAHLADTIQKYLVANADAPEDQRTAQAILRAVQAQGFSCTRSDLNRALYKSTGSQGPLFQRQGEKNPPVWAMSDRVLGCGGTIALTLGDLLNPVDLLDPGVRMSFRGELEETLEGGVYWPLNPGVAAATPWVRDLPLVPLADVVAAELKTGKRVQKEGGILFLVVENGHTGQPVSLETALACQWARERGYTLVLLTENVAV